MLTSDDLAARTDRAVAAAADAGRDLGLTVTDPRVLYDVFSVVVHLSMGGVSFPRPVCHTAVMACHTMIIIAERVG